MNNGFCAIMTKDRLYQGVALHRSLHHHVKAMKFNMFILCLDDDAYHILKELKLADTTVFHISEIEDENLIHKRSERRANEYCWTLKPVFLQFVFNQYPDIGRVTYVDADLCFFADPSVIFLDAPDDDILLSPHDFAKQLKGAENDCGKYNSGFISFTRSHISISCLEWWREKCFGWCYDRSENGKFGDQKYLDQMPSLFSGVTEIKTPGVNIAPWNQSKYRFNIQDGVECVNDDRLIFYHYCGFRIVNSGQIALTLTADTRFIPMIHGPYVHILKDVIKTIALIRPDFQGYYLEKGRKSIAKFYPFRVNEGRNINE